MPRKGQIIQLHRRRQPMMPQRILLSYDRGIEEGGGGGEVGEETQDVDGGKVDGGAGGGLAAVVEDGLGVEGGGPGDGVDPAADGGEGF